MKIQANPISCVDWDALWQLLSNGDRKGLEGLYRLFGKELFMYGLALVNDEDFVQVCIQEIFIDLWKFHQNLQIRLAAGLEKLLL